MTLSTLIENSWHCLYSCNTGSRFTKMPYSVLQLGQQCMPCSVNWHVHTSHPECLSQVATCFCATLRHQAVSMPHEKLHCARMPMVQKGSKVAHSSSIASRDTTAVWPVSSPTRRPFCACQSMILRSPQLAKRLYGLQYEKSRTPFRWCFTLCMTPSRFTSNI